MPETISLPFQIRNSQDVPLTGVPLRASVPLPQGQVHDPSRDLALIDEEGKAVAAQMKVLAPWPDGSARFVLLDYAAAELAPGESRLYTLVAADAAQGQATGCPTLKIEDTAAGVTVDAGRLKVALSKQRFNMFNELLFDGKPLHSARLGIGDIIAEDATGQLYRAGEGEFSVTVEEAGPIRAVILVEGKFGSRAGSFLNYRLRYHIVANCPHVLLSCTVRNRELPRGGVDFRRVSIEGQLALGPDNVRRIRHNVSGKMTLQTEVEIPENVDLDISTEMCLLRNTRSLRQNAEDQAWSVINEVGGSHWGNSDTIIDLHDPQLGGMCFRVQDAVLNGPVRLASDRANFTIDVFPAQAELYHFNQGMGKTRDIQLSFHGPELSAKEALDAAGLMSWPGVVGAPREWYRTCQVADIHRTLRPQPNKYILLESKIETMLDAPHSISWPRPAGWREYGDEVGDRGRMMEFGVHQYINNEEDYLFALMIDAWRKGKPYGGMPQARHLMDIDYIDFSTDPARDGADCPHSLNHTDGEVYPSHQWCEGLLLFYLATGDPEALRISKRIGDNLCYWIHGPLRDACFFSGRESAWPLLSLTALFDVTREQKYLEAALSIVNELRRRHEQHGTAMWEYPPGSQKMIAYMVPMTFNGLWDVYKVTGDPELLEFWKTLTKPYIDKLDDPDDIGYIHFRNWPIKWADLTLLDHWYELTGDERYVRLGRNGLRITLTASPDKDQMFQGFIAMGYRHFIFFLKLADEFNMLDDDKVTYVW
jgi:hypothetical protein